jgi:hypothetical protein
LFACLKSQLIFLGWECCHQPGASSNHFLLKNTLCFLMFFMLIKNTEFAKWTRGLIVALSLKTGEAFDQVEWEFMFEVL